jgi:hypothetical protein
MYPSRTLRRAQLGTRPVRQASVAALSSIVSFAMFGLLFAAPLYFQVVRGANAQGSGIRLLPLIGGMLVGGAFADRITAPSRCPSRCHRRVRSTRGSVRHRRDDRCRHR